MKLKKTSFLLVLMLMLTICINKVEAKESKTCYYMSDDGSESFKASIKFTWGFDCARCHVVEDYSEVYIDKRGAVIDHNEEWVMNWVKASLRGNTPKNSSIKFEDYYKNSKAANEDDDPDCPKYLVFQECGTFKVWATESKTEAIQAAKDISTHKNCTGYYGTTDLGDGPITAEDYYRTIADLDDGGADAPLTCDSLLGDKTDDGKTNDVGKDGVASIAYMINEIMGYVRIIVPILLIVLGMIDLARAVVAGKEDVMKQAQLTFVKRVIAGVCVFFSPLLINIIMWLAEIVWEGLGYSACQL